VGGMPVMDRRQCASAGALLAVAVEVAGGSAVVALDAICLRWMWHCGFGPQISDPIRGCTRSSRRSRGPFWKSPCVDDRVGASNKQSTGAVSSEQ
jgi:hypothetical protein